MPSQVYLVGTALITEAGTRSAHTEGIANLAQPHLHLLQLLKLL